MPIFDFECKSCGKVVEKIVSHSNKDEPIDCTCEEGKDSLHRVERIGKTSIAFKGRWFTNSGGY